MTAEFKRLDDRGHLICLEFFLHTLFLDTLKIPNAGHADSRKVSSEQYYNTVFNFINKRI
jgi:hypothetical protein